MSWRDKILRRKPIDLSPTQLVRKLTTLDLTFLGMGATLGAGAYVLVGVIAKNKTGPAIILSFLVSGLASILSALCYAEFGARVPRAGSAYVYSYVTVGELMAWTTGWQLLLEYIIGASSVARAWSGYLDTLAGGAISSYLNSHIGNWHITGLASYPDVVAFSMTIFLSIVCSLGAKESTMLNNALTTINIIVILFVCIAGLWFVNGANYGNFLPFGATGIFEGAATAFYSYVGFDVIATSAEEALNPQRAIPISIILSLILCMICYMGVAAIITLMVPYANIDENAPLASAFAVHGANWAKYIISVGAVCGLSTSLMTCIFPMPRIIYAIANDGLLPEWLGRVHSRFNTPLVATLLCGLFAAGMALIFDLSALADMMSIGTLLSYTLVAASVLVLRYREYDDNRRQRGKRERREALANEAHAGQQQHASSGSGSGSGHISAPLLSNDFAPNAAGAGSSAARRSSVEQHPAAEHHSLLASHATVHRSSSTLAVTEIVEAAGKQSGSWLRRKLLLPITSSLTGDVILCGKCCTSYSAAALLLALFSLACIFLSVGLVLLQTYTLTSAAQAGIYVLVAVGGVMMVHAFAGLLLLPSLRPADLSFTTPLMPVLPLVSMFVNIYLLVSLSPFTWVRFAVWCAIGTLIYVLYGIRNSKAPLNGDDLIDAAAERKEEAETASRKLKEVSVVGDSASHSSSNSSSSINANIPNPVAASLASALVAEGRAPAALVAPFQTESGAGATAVGAERKNS